ncbi:hypothetical protein DENSPDRAFT_883944 [Dentipellis sp. KUC8613]|nr:hypothetical protein DENSPDRAFT_883944 [Dentipellis sp. KUC8613]
MATIDDIETGSNNAPGSTGVPGHTNGMNVDTVVEPGTERMDVDPAADPDVEMLNTEPTTSETARSLEAPMDVDELSASPPYRKKAGDNKGARVPAGALDVRIAGAQRVAGNVEVVVGEPVAAAQAGGVVVTAERRGGQLRVRVGWS